MADAPSQEAHEHTFAEVKKTAGVPTQRLTLNDLQKVRLNITAELGRTNMLVREILELKRGSVIPLQKIAGEAAEIFVNQMPQATGEIMVIGDTLAVRIAEIVGANNKGEDRKS